MLCNCRLGQVPACKCFLGLFQPMIQHLTSVANIHLGTQYTIPYHTTLHYTTLHYTTLHYTTLHYTTLHCTALHCTALHCTALHCTALHYTTLHYTALHCTIPSDRTTFNFLKLHFGIYTRDKIVWLVTKCPHLEFGFITAAPLTADGRGEYAT